MENSMTYKILDFDKTKKELLSIYGNYKPFEAGVPLLDISDKTIEEVYYFRWFTYFQHIKNTPVGYVVTEFLPPVPWAGKYNTINCPAGHHLYEGRWIHNKEFLNNYSRFWFTEDGDPRRYSFWSADSILAMCKAYGDFTVAKELYEKLKENYSAWENENLMDNGLFYQIDDRDGMEFSAGGSGCRPTINSYMYGDAVALSEIAFMLGLDDEAEFYKNKAKALKEKIDAILWDKDAEFYKTLAEDKDYQLADVREQIGYVPWYFNIPDEDKTVAWKFLNDENYFYAPYGPTTAERNYKDFMKEFDHECLWNGPSWPFATSQTLTALGNLLCNYSQDVMKKSDYFNLLKQYAMEQHIEEDGKLKPFIDENLDPFTGEWIARSLLHQMENPPGGADRGLYYNHSSFCDLVITGIAGIRTRMDDALEVNPLFSSDDLQYMCADNIPYHGHSVCVMWDKDGTRYDKGFKVFVDGNEVYKSDVPEKTIINLG
ncbi:MAG: hypothetical protein UH854_03445 [Clostridia bacterium]|nr:hypothetical protein [Clostridia bacterium]